MTAPNTAPATSPTVDMTDTIVALFGLDSRPDPYVHCRRLREAGPLHRTPLGLHLTTRHRDAVAVLQNSDWSHANEAAQLHGEVAADEAAEELPTSFLWMDPPDHTRLRRLVGKAFTPRLVAGLRPRIRELVDQLIDNALAAGEFDLIETIAYPLPLTIVCELVGVPASDHRQVQEWSQWLARGFDPEVLLPPQARADRSTASRDFQAFFRALIDERRQRPQDDLLSALAAVEDRGDVLTEVELLTSCVTTVVAGHETTVNLVGNGLLALLRNPDQLQLLRDRPELVPAAVEELLRYDPPVQLTTRSATRPLTIGGRTFSEGEGVVTLINAANRDPEAFTDPDRLDLTRFHQRTPVPPHQLAFSLGIHYCLGAPLALLEMEILLERLLERVPTLDLLDDNPPYKPNIVVRGLSALPMSVRG